MSSGAEPAVDLVNALISGGEKAFRNFYRLSNGAWLDHAPEYFLTTHAAGAFHGSEKTSAWLEASVFETRAEAAAINRGRPHAEERRNGRYDIVLYWANGTPRAAIEVKSPLWYADSSRLKPDFSRLCKTLGAAADSTFQFCVFLYYASVAEPERTHSSARERMLETVNRINTHASESAQAHGLAMIPITGRIHCSTKKEGAWVLGADVFVRTGGERAFS